MSRLADARAVLDDYRSARAQQPPSLFDQAEPERSIAKVEANAGEPWMEHAVDAIRAAARQHAELTVDQVVDHITEPVHDLRALGSAMRRAARLGIIERVDGAWRTSTRPEAHHKAQALWRSRVFGAGQ